MLVSTLRLAALATAVGVAAALDFPANDHDALRSAAKKIATGVIQFDVPDNDGIGLFPDPYYWHESATAWDTLIEYGYLTGDTSYNAAARAALIAQMGPDEDYMPPNQTLHLTNWAQSRWALAAMTAAELGLPHDDDDDDAAPSWHDLARNAFDTQAARWDAETACGGGLRSQIFTFNDGYNLKESTTNAAFFHLAARLARFTGNQTHADWAARAYDWLLTTALVDASDNCTSAPTGGAAYEQPEPAAAVALGAAVMANATADPLWSDRAAKHLAHLLARFFPEDDAGSVVVDPSCQDPTDTGDACDGAAHAPIAAALHALALVPVFRPQAAADVARALNATAVAAAALCHGPTEGGDAAGVSCRGLWTAGLEDDEVEEASCDGCGAPRNATRGLGQQLEALQAVLSGFVLVGGDAVNASVVVRTVNGTAAADAGAGGNGSAEAEATATGTGAAGVEETQTGGAAAVGALGSVGLLVAMVVVGVVGLGL